MDTRIIDLSKDEQQGIKEAARLLQAGEVVAFPTETVYGLGADALNARAVEKIFLAKGRPQDNPLIVHIAQPEQAAELAQITPLAEKLMESFWPGPLTIVMRKKDAVPLEVTAGMDTVGIRLPENEYARKLILAAKTPIAAPSANVSGYPSPTRAQHVYHDLKGKIPLILDGGACSVGVESTVVNATGESCVILRPGGVTAEMIAEVLGKDRVQINDGVLQKREIQGAPMSPGMKYRHYSPKAQVFIVCGRDKKSRVNGMKHFAREDLKNNREPVILCSNKYAGDFLGLNIIPISQEDDAKETAKNLFDALRRADELNADTVYFEEIDQVGMGLAVMNRILKAAGFQKLTV